MTKRIARLALAAAAAVALAAPATQASAADTPCAGTFLVQCVRDAVASSVSQICVPYGTYEICVPPVNA